MKCTNQWSIPITVAELGFTSGVFTSEGTETWHGHFLGEPTGGTALYTVVKYI